MEEKKSNDPQPDFADRNAPDRRFPTAGDIFAMLGIVLGTQVVVALVASVVFAFSGLSADALTPEMQGRRMAFIYICSMLPALLLVLYYRRLRGGRGQLVRFSLRGLNPALLLWAFVFMLAVSVVCEPLLSQLPVPSPDYLGRGGWTLLSLVVFAPLCEELLCRGVVLGSMRSRYGVVAAWLFSSLFFGVLHLQPVLVVNAFVLGLILGFIYIVTDSLWAPILLHALNNLVGYLLMVLGAGDTLLVHQIERRWVYVVIYIGALTVTALSAWMVRQNLLKLRAAEEKNGDRA